MQQVTNQQLTTTLTCHAHAMHIQEPYVLHSLPPSRSTRMFVSTFFEEGICIVVLACTMHAAWWFTVILYGWRVSQQVNLVMSCSSSNGQLQAKAWWSVWIVNGHTSRQKLGSPSNCWVLLSSGEKLPAVTWNCMIAEGNTVLFEMVRQDNPRSTMLTIFLF